MSAPTIQGTASVIDDDTIEIRGERIRLDAIDAPESSQLCLDAAGERYHCGQKSAFALADNPVEPKTPSSCARSRAKC
jgi:endonuclease YncB( thermonuclease family)